MSQLHEQLLKSNNISMMMQMPQNMNLLNPVPIPQQMQNQANLPLNQNITMVVPVTDHKSQPNQDTSNYFS